MTNKYNVKNVGSEFIETDDNRYLTTINVDSLGKTTVSFGDAFSLTLNYNDIETLELMLNNARKHLEDQVIDQAAPAVSIPSDYTFKNPNKPENW